jgi:hypothetical protein
MALNGADGAVVEYITARKRFAVTFDAIEGAPMMLKRENLVALLPSARADSEHRRSHAVMATARGGSCLLRIGGGRYFEGTYFNDAALVGGMAVAC